MLSEQRLRGGRAVRRLCEHTFVRWETQTVQREAGARLPGYRDVTVRHFDAPEAVDTRFYEVEAKSILNHVPPASQMPFRWTVNPYRGCVHACTYCLSGETPILLADGRPRALADLDIGDAIYGTVAEGGQRRYVATRVLAKWSTVKPAFRLVRACHCPSGPLRISGGTLKSSSTAVLRSEGQPNEIPARLP